MGFEPTDEQKAVIEACASGHNLIVEAGAGTGKTSTMRMAAEHMRGRGLYLAYNRAIRDEAAAKFPRNVDCKTGHGLAFPAFGKKYLPRIKQPRQNGKQVAQILGITERAVVGESTVLTPDKIARMATSAVRRFQFSADEDVRAWHVERPEGADDELYAEIQHVVLSFARRAWSDMRSPEGRLNCQHDTYLKMFALTRPELRYDFLILDEAQDSNPVITDLIQRQTNAQIVAVGDRAQSIYGWRGARDAMQHWPAEKRLFLSRSFRFGPAVADEANKWLPHCRTPLRVTGTDTLPTTVEQIPGTPDAVLCRTNATAVSEVMDALNEGLRPALVGGTTEIVRLADAAADLKAGKPTGHPELMLFNSWGDVQEFVAEDDSGADLKVFVDLIDKHGPDVIKESLGQVADESYADVVISTAHRAKGREWNRVRIADDFRHPGRDEDGELKPIRKSEAMLAYVAVTRAQRVLDRGGLSWIDEYDQQPQTTRAGRAA